MKEQRIEKLKELLKFDPDDAFARYALGLEYGGMDRHDEAAAMFEEVLRRNPNYVPAYQQLGYTYRTLGRDKEAAAILTEGMHVARAQGDSHASAEMQEALDELH